MKHAEVIFEPGSKSVVSFESEDELKSFLAEHHRRAVAGDSSGQENRPAERIKRVLLYEGHPASATEDATVALDTVSNLAVALAKDGQVNVHDLATALRREVSATHTQPVEPHSSLFKTPETGELDLSFLNDAGESAGA